MKNQWMKKAATLAFAIFFVAGMNAQQNSGRGMGPCGQGGGPGGPIYGQGYGQSFGQAGGGFGTALKARLDLTEAQQEQLSALRLDHYKSMKPLRSEMAELNARKQTLLSQEEVELKAVNRVIDQQSDLSNKIQKKQVANWLVCREILTDEQQMILDQGRRASGNLKANRPYGKRIHRGQGFHSRAY